VKDEGDPEVRRRNVVKGFRQRGFHFYGQVGGARQLHKGGGKKKREKRSRKSPPRALMQKLFGSLMTSTHSSLIYLLL